MSLTSTTLRRDNARTCSLLHYKDLYLSRELVVVPNAVSANIMVEQCEIKRGLIEEQRLQDLDDEAPSLSMTLASSVAGTCLRVSCKAS